MSEGTQQMLIFVLGVCFFIGMVATTGELQHRRDHCAGVQDLTARVQYLERIVGSKVVSR